MRLQLQKADFKVLNADNFESDDFNDLNTTDAGS